MLQRLNDNMRDTLDDHQSAIARWWSRRRQILATSMQLLSAWKSTLAVIVLGGGLALYFAVPAIVGPLVPVNAMIRADLVQTVVASGHVEAPYRVNVASQIMGVVSRVAVAEGQTVKAGDPLVYLDDRELRAAMAQAEGVVAQAEARMRQLRELTLPSAEESLNQARATQTNAQQAFDRAAALAKTGYGSRATLDDATRALNIAQAAVRHGEVQVYTNKPGGSDYVMAEMLLSQARANLASAQSRLSYTVISAPRDGVLISRNVEAGHVVQPGIAVMKLSPAGDTEVIVQIDEKNLGALRVGQKALASADAYPKQSFPAEVVFINPGVDLQRASVEVKLRVTDPPSYLREDMTVSVDIEVARRSNALIAPTAAVHALNTASPWIMTAETGRAVQQPVKIGLIGVGQVEILEGLDESSLVVPASAQAIKIGRRVRPEMQTDGLAP